MRITVDDAHVVRGRALLHNLLQRPDNQRYRRADLMGNHRKEVQASLTHLFLLLCVQPLYLLLMLMLGTLQAETYIIPDSDTYQ